MRKLFLLFALTASGCGSDPCARDPVSCLDAGSDSGLPLCTGQCLTLPQGWHPGFLLWSDMQGGTMPACPHQAQGRYPGYLDTPPMVECPPCSCSPSGGRCDMSTKMTAHKDACPGTAENAVPFDAPNAWDGTCTAMDPIPSAASLDAPPPYIANSEACQPSDNTPTKMDGGKIRSLMCVDNNSEEEICPKNERCMPPPAPGFSLCIRGDDNTTACPDGWPIRHVEYSDIEACTCWCGDPMGQRCTSTLTVYSDAACSQPLGSAMLLSDQPNVCIDTPPGSTFGSKSATPPSFQAGTCTPNSGKNEGATLCCRAE